MSGSTQSESSAHRGASARCGRAANPGLIGWLRGVLERIGTVILAVLCGALIFDRVLMPQVVRHGDETPVPSVATVRMTGGRHPFSSARSSMRLLTWPACSPPSYSLPAARRSAIC